MATDRDIAEVLTELGFADPASQNVARAALEQSGLTHAGKKRISVEKVDKVRALLDATFARACVKPTCQESVRRERPNLTLVRVLDSHGCQFCGGSDNRQAMRRLEAACKAAHLSRIVVVGGSPSVREELLALKPDGLELRLIDGTDRRTQDKAKHDLDWADLVLVWGASELDHRVSRLYTDATGPAKKKIVQIARRGIAALLNAGAEYAEKRRS